MTNRPITDYKDSTIACTAGIAQDKNHAAIIPPLYLSATYQYPDLGVKGDYIYSRSGNPTRDLLAQTLAELEGGAGATITASGMAAVTLTFQLLTSADTVFAAPDCYGGIFRLLKAKEKSGHCKTHFFNPEDLDALARDLETYKPKMLILETPANPTLRVTDIRAVARLTQKHGTIFVVDNTFMSPAFQKPLELGADIVIHSTTKLINGHSDIIGGAVIAKTQELLDELKWWNNCLGIGAAPFDCYLAMRGLRTLEVRVKQQAANAQKVAEWLETHADVEKVYYPGLKSHAQHDIAKAQQKGFGTMISVEIREKDKARVAQFIRALNIFNLAESLGGMESLICHPPSMTHAPLNDQELAEAGIAKGLLRLSIGLEDADDLINDLERGFAVLRDEKVKAFPKADAA